MSKRVYLAGPMTGIPGFNFPLFNQAAADLRAQGFEVFNPAEKDNDIYGEGIGDNPTGSIEEIKESHNFDPRETIRVDLMTIIDWADAIYLLPGWQNSRGAKAEVALGEYLGLEFVQLD